MSLVKDSIKKQIKNENRATNFNNTTADIVDYDKTTQTCKIQYKDPNSGTVIKKGNVSIVGNIGGTNTGSSLKGKKCSISFINGNLYSPVIQGVYETTSYQQKTSADQGAYIANDEVYKTGTPEHIIAMNLDWIDEDNKDVDKYNNELSNYHDTDAELVAIELNGTLDKFQEKETGMVNINNKSTIKCKENGDIDIFTSNNTGIRICKSGNIKIYGNDVEFTKSDSESEKTDKSISTQLKVAQIMKICVAYDIIKETDTLIETLNTSMDDITSLNSDQTSNTATSEVL